MDKNVLHILSEIGASVATEKDVGRVLETILSAAKQVTGADGATLYKVHNGTLVFEAIISDALGFSASGTDHTLATSFPPIPLYTQDGQPVTDTVAAFAVVNDVTVNIDDAYHAEGFDFSGTRRFDQRTGYRSRSFLTVPIKDADGRPIAAMQLINATDSNSGQVTCFSADHQRLVEALACQAAVAMEKHRLSRYENALKGSLVVRSDMGPRQLSRVDLIAALELCRVPPSLAAELASQALGHMVDEDQVELTENELNGLMIRLLEAKGGQKAAIRYQAWSDFRESGLPLVILLGGTSGTGKSTVASELALRLDIGRIQSTDILREVMRLLVSPNLVPEVHHSSYDAWQSIQPPNGTTQDASGLLIQGYHAQAGKVALAIDGVLRRAIKERVSTIVEGIHLPPSYYERLAGEDAVVVPVLLAIPDQDALQSRFQRRGEHAPSRGATRYIDNLAHIMRLQDHFIAQAQQYRVPVVPNIRSDQTTRQVLGIVADALTTRFCGSSGSTEPKS